MKLFLERLLEEGTSPPSDGEGEEEITDEDNDLRNTLRIYGSIFLLLLLLASLCRKKFPRAYAIRSWVERYKTPLAYDSYGFLSWIWKLFSLSDSEMMEECGMDAICFIRVLEFGMKVAAVGVINAIWLVIVYRTEPDGGDQKSVLAGLSTAKLPTGSNRFIATVIACYVIFGFCMYTIIQEFKWFIKFRHTFLSRHMPRNYTVRKKLANNAKLSIGSTNLLCLNFRFMYRIFLWHIEAIKNCLSFSATHMKILSWMLDSLLTVLT
jgi:hypothetical protein